MPRGGDRRPIERLQGMDLSLATLLLKAMTKDISEAGERFNNEREVLFQRWERLVRVIDRHPPPGYGSFPSVLDAVENWLKGAAIAWPVLYPMPRQLTPEEQAEFKGREEVAQKLLGDLYPRLRQPVGPQNGEAWQTWNQAVTSLHSWTREIFLRANPGRLQRTSRRIGVRKYHEEVRDFCERWRLRAWWAVPAIVHSHFLRVRTGLNGLLDLYVVGTWNNNEIPIVAPLPGTTNEEFERDFPRLRDLMLEKVLEPKSGTLPGIVVRWRPDRAEMTRREERLGAKSVVVDWDGSESFRSHHDPTKRLSLVDYVLEQCELRVVRGLSKHERRWIVQKIQPQVEAARRRHLESGFGVIGSSNAKQTAAWIAQRLLYPQRSWTVITKSDVDQLPSVIRACTRYAKAAGLTLP